MSGRRRLPPGARWVTLPSGERRVELVVDIGTDPATGKRRQSRRRFKTLDEALEEYSKIKGAVRDGSYVGKSTTSVAQVVNDWLDGRRAVEPTTLAGYRNWLKPVVAVCGALPVQKLSKRDLDALIPRLTAGELTRADGRQMRPWRARSVNAMLGVLVDVLNDALKQGLVTRNVAALVDRLPQVKTERETYTAAEVKQVLATARADRLEVAWHLALYGLRRGEIAGLRWSAVDFGNRRLTINLGRVSVDGQARESTPKTARSNRTLPLTDDLVTVLERAQRKQDVEREKVGKAYRRSGFVVVDEVGRALHPETLSTRWDALVAAAGVRRIALHDARHTCGTLLHLQGVPIAVISQWLGHATADFTMRTYVHSQDDALAAAAVVMGGVTSA